MNNRLRLTPATAYKELTDNELLTLRHHRDEIKAIVKETVDETAAPEPTAAPTAAPAPVESVPCPFCHRAPCYGSSHFAYRALHYHDPEVIKRRDAEATAEMNEAGRRRTQGLPRIQW